MTDPAYKKKAKKPAGMLKRLIIKAFLTLISPKNLLFFAYAFRSFYPPI